MAQRRVGIGKAEADEVVADVIANCGATGIGGGNTDIEQGKCGNKREIGSTANRRGDILKQ
jgi:hypothetical protein